MRTMTGLVLIAVVVVAAACGADEDLGSRGPYNAEVFTDPERMRAEPDVVATGGEFDAVFPTGYDRGPGFVLERDTEEGWEFSYTVSSHGGSSESAITMTADEFVRNEIVWVGGPAFDGTEPHGIPVPDDAEAGRWRICTAPDLPALCAGFEVTADGE